MRPVLALACVALACGPRTAQPSDRGVPWAASGVDWSTPPLVRTVDWTAPAIAQTTLANGIRILVVENHRLPLVALTVLHGAAGSREDGARPGLAALALTALGAASGIEGSIGTDHAAQHATFHARDLRAKLAVLSTWSSAPAVADVNKIRAQRLDELDEHRSQTRRIAAQVFDRVVFGEHAYARPAEGTATSVAALTHADVDAFWTRAYRPDALTIIVTGDTTLADARAAVDAAFGSWRAPNTPRPPVAPLPTYAPQLAYVDVPGAAETNVIVGRRAPGAGGADPSARDNPSPTASASPHVASGADLLAANVANTIIGAGEDGRLDRELHARLALTFGASASFWRGEAGGSWAAAATFSTANTGAGLRALLAVLGGARTTEPSADELSKARRDLAIAAQRQFDTVAGTARAVERLVTQDRPLDSYATLEGRLDALTAPAVRDALVLTDLSIVVVGDWSRLAEGLQGLGLTPTPYQP